MYQILCKIVVSGCTHGRMHGRTHGRTGQNYHVSGHTTLGGGIKMYHCLMSLHRELKRQQTLVHIFAKY